MIRLTRPTPPRLSEAADQLREIEQSGVFSNFGPVNTRFEQDLLARMFAGTGGCVTVCNATLGLMLAIRAAIQDRPAGRRFALMPSFTFAAAAQAADWCGLTPLFCDIDPHRWASDPAAEAALLRRYRDQIAVIVPYATFGAEIDLDQYTRLSRRHGIPVVVDAAASLGSLTAEGTGFGTGFPGAVVFSMHATKSFATGEGGVIYSADPALVQRLRAMCNFGFGQPRNATMPGLNAKLSEIGALLAHLQLQRYDDVIRIRETLMQHYRARLPALTFQREAARRQAHQFAPALLPRWMAPLRAALQARLKDEGIEIATYFSPHVMQQDYFAAAAVAGRLSVTQDVADRIISLPIHDALTTADVATVAGAINTALQDWAPRDPPAPATRATDAALPWLPPPAQTRPAALTP